jgi:hypothetical protein
MVTVPTVGGSAAATVVAATVVAVDCRTRESQRIDSNLSLDPTTLLRSRSIKETVRFVGFQVA